VRFSASLQREGEGTANLLFGEAISPRTKAVENSKKICKKEIGI
jgi:hypothetical protein